MATSLSNYDEILKVFYLPAIQEQLNHDTILSDKIEVNEEDVSGKDFTIECHYGRSGGHGARADGGTLPTARYQKYKTMTVPMRYNYGRVNFTGPTIAATRDEKGAYARVIDSEITGITRDVKKDINRQYWGCGYGIIARWSSGNTNTSAATTIYLQKAYRGNTAEPDGAFGSTFGAKYFDDHGWVQGADPTTAGAATALVIDSGSTVEWTTVDRTTSKTQDSVVNPASSQMTNAMIAGDWFIRPANLSAITATSATTLDAAREEMMGLRGIVTNTDLDDIAFNDGSTTGFQSTYTDPLQGLAIGTYSWWKALVDTHTSGRYQGQRALTLDLMQTMFDNVEEKGGKDYSPDMILTARPVRRQYLELCQADRIVVNEMKLDGGWTALSYNGVPFTVDNDAIDGEIYFLTLKEFSIYRMSDYDWLDRDGAILHRINNQDAYDAVLYRYAELGCRRRNIQGVICDIAYNL